MLDSMTQFQILGIAGGIAIFIAIAVYGIFFADFKENEVKGLHNGITYFGEWHGNGDDGYSYLIKIDSSISYKFFLTIKSPLDERLLKTLKKVVGISTQDIQTGDEYFDKKISIETQDNDVIERFKNDRELRDAILNVMSCRANSLTCTGGTSARLIAEINDNTIMRFSQKNIPLKEKELDTVIDNLAKINKLLV
jgi:hypothetical protein